jgi:hypothetical protein
MVKLSMVARAKGHTPPKIIGVFLLAQISAAQKTRA